MQVCHFQHDATYDFNMCARQGENEMTNDTPIKEVHVDPHSHFLMRLSFKQPSKFWNSYLQTQPMNFQVSRRRSLCRPSIVSHAVP